MSKVIRDNWNFIQLLIKSSSLKQQKALLNSITQDQLRALSEIAVNVLYGNIPLTTRTKAKLKPYKVFYTHLADKKNSLKQKQLTSNINAIQLLLKAVLTFLQSVL